MIKTNYIEQIEELLKQNNGTILTADLDKWHIPRYYLAMLVADGKLERVNRGIYISSDSIEDVMFSMQRKYSKLVYSHETALFMHDLTDRTPIVYSATVPSGYKIVKNISDRSKIYYIKKELYNKGMINGSTIFGNTVKVYNIERTICDIVRSRNRIDIQILTDALKRYARLKPPDYLLLMEYARKFHIEKIIRTYLQVLI